MLEVSVDEGALSFSLDGGPRLHALSGFPPASGLRPWVRSWKHGDTVTMSGWV